MTTKELNLMKVVDLRDQLRLHGLKVSGVKQELVERLAKHYKSSRSVNATTVPAVAEAAEVLPNKPAAVAPVMETNAIAAATTVTTHVTEATEVPTLSSCTLPSSEEVDSFSTPPSTMAATTDASSVTPCELTSTEAVDSLSAAAELACPRPEQLPQESCADDSNGKVGTLSDTALPEVPVEPNPQLQQSEVATASNSACVEESNLESGDANAASHPPVEEQSVPGAVASEPQLATPSKGASESGFQPQEMPGQQLHEVTSQIPPAAAPESQNSMATECQNATTISKRVIKAESPKVAMSPEAKMPSAVPSRQSSRPARTRTLARMLESSPLSPTAVLAGEVIAPEGTPTKEEDTVVKSAQQTWRKLCARQAARFRIDKRQDSTGRHDSRSPSPLPRCPQQLMNEAFKGEGPPSQSSQQRANSRSRSPRVPVQSPVSSRPKVILRRRRSVLQKSPAALTRSSSRTAAFGRSVSPAPSRSRSPVASQSRKRARNCIFASTPRASPKFTQGTPISMGKPSQQASVNLTPQELRARLRCEELRKELLRRSASAKKLCGDAHNATPTPARNNTQDAEDVQAEACAAASATQRSAAASEAQAPAVSVNPRNLAGALQDAADDSGSRQQIAQSKKQMLEQLTQQMQKCLERVQDTRLDDAGREKYQALASSIQAQIEKISNLRRGRSTAAKGGC